MSKVLIEEQTLYDIGDAIREKNGLGTTYKPSEMAHVIENLQGDDAAIQTLVGAATGSVKINNIPSIGAYAFCSHRNVTGIEAPDTLVIGDYAFSGCTSLSAVSFPECTKIGNYAFNGCTHLSEASFPVCTTIGNYVFIGCKSLSALSFPECTTIGNYAFNSCKSFSEVSFPVCNSVGWGAFLNCSNLSKVYFPACTTVGDEAFRYCPNLTEASFPVCISVSNSAFHYCSSVESFSFPMLETIMQDSFGRCYMLSSFYAPNLTNITGITPFWLAGQSASSTIVLNFPKLRGVGSRVFEQFIGLGAMTLVSCSFISSSGFTSAVNLMSLYLLSSSVVSLNASNAFVGTPMQNSSYTGTFGSIFVPSELVDLYKSATNWSIYADRITAYTGE